MAKDETPAAAGWLFLGVLADTWTGNGPERIFLVQAGAQVCDADNYESLGGVDASQPVWPQCSNCLSGAADL
ncbi:hypothetical protein ACLKA6_010116 [Drosophila palustris]